MILDCFLIIFWSQKIDTPICKLNFSCQISEKAPRVGFEPTRDFGCQRAYGRSVPYHSTTAALAGLRGSTSRWCAAGRGRKLIPKWYPPDPISMSLASATDPKSIQNHRRIDVKMIPFEPDLHVASLRNRKSNFDFRSDPALRQKLASVRHRARPITRSFRI